jgi:hypothetical protein
MLDYIKENCKLPPLNRPQFDDETDTWDIYFEENAEGSGYDIGDEMVCLAFESLEEANKVLKDALELYYEESDAVTKAESPNKEA